MHERWKVAPLVAVGTNIYALPGMVEINIHGNLPAVLLDQRDLDQFIGALLRARKQAFPRAGAFDFIDPREVM